jgi:general secretion pathway protein G
MTPRQAAFTLVEIMIVVMLLAILAMVVVPEVAGSTDRARESALATDLQAARRQLQLYKVQHYGRSPHVDETSKKDTDNFVARLTGRTDPDGTINPAGACGPYLTQWPTNPFISDAAKAADIKFAKSETPPRDDSTGWYYSTRACELHVNSSRGAESID